MVDFIFNRPQPESPDWAMEQQDLATSPTLGQTIATGAMEATGAIQRFGEEAQYEPGLFGTIGRALVGGGLAEADAKPEDVASALQQKPDPVQRPAAEINAQAGASITDKPMGSNLADLLISAKQKEIERENIWSRYTNAHAWPVNLAVGTASFLADPLNVATLFVPGIGEEAILARLGTGLAGRLAAGAASQALGVTAAQLPLTALKYGIGREEASDYDLRSAFVDMAMNAGAGAILGAGFGAVGHLLHGRTEASRILAAPADSQHAATSAAVAQIVEGRPVDVEPFFPKPPEPAMTAVGQVMEHPFLAPRLATPEPIAGLKFLPPTFETPAEFAEKMRALYRGGYAAGVPQAEIDATHAALAERHAHPPTPPKVEEKPPEGWGQPAGEAPGTFKTTMEIGGQRTVIEGPTPGGEVITAAAYRQHIAAVGGDMGTAANELVSRVGAALKQGRGVTYHAEGKAIPIVDTQRGMMVDAEGKPWGTMLLTSQGNHLDIGHMPERAAQRAEESPSRGAKLQYVAPEELDRLHREVDPSYPPSNGLRGADYFSIKSGAEEVGHAIIRKEGPIARVETIESSGPNSIGVRDMRDLLRQYRDLYPDVTEITGNRISGAREGGEYTAGAEHETAIPLEHPVESDPEIQAAETRLAEIQGARPLLPEEQAALDETRDAVTKADQLEQAFQEAANCLKESGI